MKLTVSTFLPLHINIKDVLETYRVEYGCVVDAKGKRFGKAVEGVRVGTVSGIELPEPRLAKLIHNKGLDSPGKVVALNGNLFDCNKDNLITVCSNHGVSQIEDSSLFRVKLFRSAIDVVDTEREALELFKTVAFKSLAANRVVGVTDNVEIEVLSKLILDRHGTVRFRRNLKVFGKLSQHYGTLQFVGSMGGEQVSAARAAWILTGNKDAGNVPFATDYPFAFSEGSFVPDLSFYPPTSL